jgi:dihydrodipicolinate synthase/N-acetylneuraminate lyase
MGRIQERVPQLAGLKHSALDFANVRRFARMGLSCFSGSGRLTLPALTIGACGVIDGPPCVAPELWVAIWNAYQDGDLQRAEAAQAKASELYDALTRSGFHASAKAMMSERLGIECGSPRPPLSRLTTAQRAYIRDETRRLGLSGVAPAAAKVQAARES